MCTQPLTPPPQKKMGVVGTNNSIGCLTYFIVNEGIPYTKIKFRNENDDQPEKSALLKQIIFIWRKHQ